MLEENENQGLQILKVLKERKKQMKLEALPAQGMC